jgi:hypothetical protein
MNADTAASAQRAQQQPNSDANSDSDEFVFELSLMLMYLSSWKERPYEMPRFWKGFDFDLACPMEELAFTVDI